jgi:flagellar biosynthesis protein FlhA
MSSEKETATTGPTARTADLLMTAGLVMILATLVIPVPAMLLDLLLVLSIGMALLLLVITAQLTSALQLSSFPSILLMLTLFRLSLNVGTTRQILLHGYAGNVIQAFGDFVVGGNYIVGIVVFLVLVTINFMVITKGSGRIAEVAARFTLDAMPGKQMSIDADPNAGLIDEKAALQRRETIAQEADFYGAMDGASKFVKGDAVAGLIITGINILGGFTIGMVQQGMSAGEALRRFTILTVGDGLVAQIPALVISTAAGMLVTRAATKGTLGSELGRQMFSNPRPLVITGGLLCIVAIVPGLPFVPFLALGAGIGGLGLVMKKKADHNKAEGDAATKAKPAPDATDPHALPPSDTKHIPAVSPMDLEIGFGLVSLVDRKQGGRLIDRIAAIRGRIAEELGLILPPINVRDNITLKNTEYSICMRGLRMSGGSVRPSAFMAINPGHCGKLPGYTAVKEPTFGFDAYWIPEAAREQAEAKGMAVVDCSSVITTHLAEICRQHADQILNRQDVSEMLDKLKETHESVVQELIPNKLGVGHVHRVLQALLHERVSIRDLSLILEALADHAGRTQDVGVLSELVRRALGPFICHRLLGDDGGLAAIGVHPDLEAAIDEHIARDGNGLGVMNLPPSLAQSVLTAIKASIEPPRKEGVEPVILCSPTLRPHMKRLLAPHLPDLSVLSFMEVPDTIDIRMLGMATVPGPVMEEAKVAA